MAIGLRQKKQRVQLTDQKKRSVQLAEIQSRNEIFHSSTFLKRYAVEVWFSR